MMQIDIRSHVAEATRFLADVHKRHIPIATYAAATWTAEEVKQQEIKLMHRVFDRPTPYTINALYKIPATKHRPYATVEFKDTTTSTTAAKRWLNPNIHGGPRSSRASERQLALLMGSSFFVAPARGAPLDQYGNLKRSIYSRILSQLKVARDPYQNASDSRRSKGKRSASAFFIPKKGGAVFERKGKAIRPILIFIRPPQYKKIFPFYETATAIISREYPRIFKTALDRAIETSNYKGKWR